MRIIAPYIKREPHSLWALNKHARKAIPIDTSGSIYAYNETIAEYWTGQEDLVVIEQDKVITHQVLPSFQKCKKPWCTYSAYIFPKPLSCEVDIGLSCARFTAELQRMINPSEFLCQDDPKWSKCELCAGKGCWRYLDARIARAIQNHGINVHCHGHIKHYHDYGILGKLCE